MEYAIILGGAYLIYNWYQNTFVKPFEESKEFINQQIIEPVKEFAEDTFEKAVNLTQDAFEAGQEVSSIKANFEEGVRDAAFAADIERTNALIAGGQEAAKHIQPVTKEIEHSFKEGIESIKEENKDVLDKGVKDVGKGDIKGVLDELTQSGMAAERSFDKAVSKGAKDIGGEASKAGQKVSEDFKETVDRGAKPTEKQAKKTQEQAKQTGDAIARF